MPDMNDWYFTFLCQPACYISADLWKPQRILNIYLFETWKCFPWGGRGTRVRVCGECDLAEDCWQTPDPSPRGRLPCQFSVIVFGSEASPSVPLSDLSAPWGQHQRCRQLTHLPWQPKTDTTPSSSVYFSKMWAWDADYASSQSSGLEL